VAGGVPVSTRASRRTISAIIAHLTIKTLKYRPDFPTRFASIEAARRHCQTFFGWYNDEHRHTGLGLHVPADVHYGRAQAVHAERASVLGAAYAAHPERFVHKPPAPPSPPTAPGSTSPSRRRPPLSNRCRSVPHTG
jgi:hypothetical protein